METQKSDVLKFVEAQRKEGRTVKECLMMLGVSRASYYRWLKGGNGSLQREPRPHARKLTPEEITKIDAVKEAKPELRHRRVQGELQKEGIYVSYSSVYQRLKSRNLVEPYDRRDAPWKEPRYEVWRKCTIWGADWTKLRIGGIRWYLLTLIDFFSRYIEAYRIVPSVNASHIKEIYRAGLSGEGIPLDWHLKPELRVDRGSPNTSWVTKDFFKDIAADLSFARVRRPTDNSLTERFYGSIKQEEIYVVGNYPDHRSAEEEIGRYMEYYNHKRPHQALWNFTPSWIHELNNKTDAFNFWKEMKKKTWEKRKDYWINNQQNDSQKSMILSH